nr:glycogen/starch/alpha-glucan phosphorylase [Solobacterium sp.]
MTFEKLVTTHLGKPVSEASDAELFAALTQIVREKAQKLPHASGDKKVYYISAEFLIGKQLGKNLINLGLYDMAAQLLKKNGRSLSAVEAVEKEPSLGNGGLGRLAACFLDSIASLDMNGDGIGLNYHYGLFRQQFRNKKQYEVPDEWLEGNTILKDTGTTFTVSLANKEYTSHMYDMDVIGSCGVCNHLHLFDLDTVDDSVITDGIRFDKTDIAKNLTLFLYPDDSDHEGKLLRIYQQYFMVSSAAQLILKEEKEKGHDLDQLDRHVAIQINDTHPSLIIPELIRLLVSEGIVFRRAAEIVTNVCAYTNHTILAEALEKWP